MPEDMVRTTILEVLRPKAEHAGLSMTAIGDRDLMDLGIIDSMDMLDMTMEVERRTGCSFVWDLLELQSGLSVSTLTTAFRVK